SILYRDIRTYEFTEKYYTKAREKGVRFIRYNEDNKPQVSNEGGKLSVNVYDDNLGDSLSINPDLLVLAPAIVHRDNAEELNQLFKVSLTQEKFFLEAHMKLRPIDFATEGIFMCGLAHAPKTSSESIAQALGAASRAATILSKDKLELEAAISEVVNENCDGCAYCIDPCPFDALTLIEYMSNGSIKKTVERDEVRCQGCGICQATCPKAGIFVRHFKLAQLNAMVEAALEQ
ncbi:MAG: 4Fe-4S dicluster domain-containing protein, partial [Nitrospinota bacterium]